MKFHRLARYFPLLNEEELDLLAESIRKNGQREPIVTYEGQILDGINRWRACQKLGIEPEYRELPEGTDPLQYVVDMNIRRRHLDVSQRAMLATEMLPEFEEAAEKNANEGRREAAKEMRPEGSKVFAARSSSIDEEPRATRGGQSSFMAAKVFGVSGPTIQRAKRVKEDAPDRVADIVSGKTTVTAVDAELRQKHATERAAEHNQGVRESAVKQRPKIVSDYFDALKQYRQTLELAVEAARQELFADESRNIIVKKHDAIKSLMAQLEGNIGEKNA